jgi:hypothetical protein
MQSITPPSNGLFNRRAILSGLGLAIGGGAVATFGWSRKKSYPHSLVSHQPFLEP